MVEHPYQSGDLTSFCLLSSVDFSWIDQKMKTLYQQQIVKAWSTVTINWVLQSKYWKPVSSKWLFPHTFSQKSPLQTPNLPVQFLSIFGRFLQRGLLINHSQPTRFYIPENITVLNLFVLLTVISHLQSVRGNVCKSVHIFHNTLPHLHI